MEKIPPKEMADQIVKLIRKQHPDSNYLKKVFQYVREELALRSRMEQSTRLPELMTEDELKRFFKAVWHASNRTHMVMLKLMLFTGIRNQELANITLQHVNLDSMRIRISHGKGDKDRYVLFPRQFQ